ncbi:hypothetical protein RAS1_16660 [Phycisphaerae bacterium RAS1]|nr:hypothetical protein RAS1_16660 [Phycisphaerae bacterium RAS1]
MAQHASFDPASVLRENRRLDDVAPKIAAAGLVVGLIGVGASLGLSLMQGGLTLFFRSYVMNFCYVMSFALGALFFVALQHVTKAGWSVVVRRLAELIAASIPVLAVLFIPVVAAVALKYETVYPWANPDYVKADESGMIARKVSYLNLTWFAIRCIAYFGLWTWLASFFLRKSVEQDATGDVNLTHSMQWFSGPAVMLYALSLTFFAFDVLMSLSPKFFSTIFGVYYFSGSMVGFFALLAILCHWLQSQGRLTHVITQEHYHDIGKLMFAFTVFWAYIGFSQYMLIWYANVPEETFWIRTRQSTPFWAGVGLTLLFGHFVLPFVALVSRFPKRRPQMLVPIACWMLLMHWVDMFWLVAPGGAAGSAGAWKSDEPGVALYGAEHLLTALTGMVGLAGLFVWAVMLRMGRTSLLAERDPRLPESLAFQNF